MEEMLGILLAEQWESYLEHRKEYEWGSLLDYLMDNLLELLSVYELDKLMAKLTVRLKA